MTEYEGTISTNGKGVGFFRDEALGDATVRIEPDNLKTAFHGDRVRVRILPEPPLRGKPGDLAGAVEEILERGKTRLVGIAEKEKGSLFVVPDDQHFYKDFLLTGDTGNIPDHTKVFIELVPWNDPKKNPEASLIEAIGPAGDHEVETRALLLERGIDSDFPAAIETEAEEVKRMLGPLTDEDLTERRDMRETTTFTIDPDDAKDFDDALSVAARPDDTYEIGIHIADVSFYVRPGTLLDQEARRRAFSTYLVDRTIPMLPEILSNDLCSLNPNEDKRAFSAVFILDKNAHIIERWFGRTLIRSDKRFTYKEAQGVLDENAGPFHTELTTLRSIGMKLAEWKARLGAIDFGDNEFKFELDEKGSPVKVYRKERLETNRLIEDFMLLANREVAEFIHKEQKRHREHVLLFRIHDAPKPEKLADLSRFLKALGLHLPHENSAITAKDINDLFQEIEGMATEPLIRTATLRTMSKAIYSTNNIGHFGLGFKTYAHFTSPIRRYADLTVHRILATFLKGKTVEASPQTFETLATELSQKEISVVDAERESVKRKQIEYLAQRIGQTLEGTITGVTDFGFFVADNESGSEGLVRMRDIGDDFYALDAKRYRIVGEKTKKTFALGDTVRVKVADADVERRTADFVLA